MRPKKKKIINQKKLQIDKEKNEENHYHQG